MYKGSPKGCNTKAERSGWNKPTRTDPFAGHVRRDLENNVRDVEDGDELVVIVARELKILFKTGKPGITNVGTINEAE